MSTRKKRLLLTGGGTGGHLFPAIAVAEEFCKEYPSTEVLFVGTKRKMDAQALAGYDFSSRRILCYGLKGKSVKELVKALLVLPISCLQSLWILLSFRPDVVVGVGGYVTGPVVAMAKLLGFKTIIHEQNSVPGLANRKLGKIVDKICVSLPGSAKYFPAEKVVLTGNPIRKNIAGLATQPPVTKDEGDITVLVLGGSLGATGLNRLVVDAFTGVDAEKLSHIKLIHQTGAKDHPWVVAEYKAAGREVNCQAFFTNMDDIYRDVDFLVCRAGATTLAEISVLGKPAIFIPFPAAADNHQLTNARYYVDGGGAEVYEEKAISATELAEAIERFAGDREALAKMATAQRRLGMPLAAKKILDVCKGLVS